MTKLHCQCPYSDAELARMHANGQITKAPAPGTKEHKEWIEGLAKEMEQKQKDVEDNLIKDWKDIPGLDAPPNAKPTSSKFKAWMQKAAKLWSESEAAIKLAAKKKANKGNMFADLLEKKLEL